jgi:hypothetical protein
MLDRIQQFDLSDGSVGEALEALFDPGDLFDGVKFLPVFPLTNFVDSSVGSLADDLQRKVLFLCGFEVRRGQRSIVVFPGVVLK